MFATLLTPLDVNGIELFLATSVDDDGRPMRQGGAGTCKETSEKKKSDDGQGEQCCKALQCVGVKLDMQE